MHVVHASSQAPTAPQAEPALNHLPGLDGVRGVAILLVIAHNLATVQLPASGVGHLLELSLDLGWIGVQLFFVLSGFLITRILMQTQAAPNHFRAFFGRRVLRIFPLYYAALLVAFVIVPWVGTPSAALAHDQQHQQWLWLYLSNWTGVLSFESQVFPHFWSLAIEEQFYLLWPFLIYRMKPRQVLALCLVIAAVALGARIWMVWHGALHEEIYTYTVCRMDALALGAAVAAWLQCPGVRARLVPLRDRVAIASAFLALVGVVLTHGYPRLGDWGQTLGYTWLALVFALAVLAVALSDPHGDAAWLRLLRWAPLRTLGFYSYAMYVFHKPLHDHVGRPLLMHFGLLDQPSSVVALAYVSLGAVVTLLLAVASYHLFEKHFLSMKRWFVAEPAVAAGAVKAPAR